MDEEFINTPEYQYWPTADDDVIISISIAHLHDDMQQMLDNTTNTLKVRFRFDGK